MGIASTTGAPDRTEVLYRAIILLGVLLLAAGCPPAGGNEGDAGADAGRDAGTDDGGDAGVECPPPETISFSLSCAEVAPGCPPPRVQRATLETQSYGLSVAPLGNGLLVVRQAFGGLEAVGLDATLTPISGPFRVLDPHVEDLAIHRTTLLPVPGGFLLFVERGWTDAIHELVQVRLGPDGSRVLLADGQTERVLASSQTSGSPYRVHAHVGMIDDASALTIHGAMTIKQDEGPATLWGRLTSLGAVDVLGPLELRAVAADGSQKAIFARQIMGLPDGGFVVAGTTDDFSDSRTHTVWSQRFDATLRPLGDGWSAEVQGFSSPRLQWIAASDGGAATLGMGWMSQPDGGSTRFSLVRDVLGSEAIVESLGEVAPGRSVAFDLATAPGGGLVQLWAETDDLEPSAYSPDGRLRMRVDGLEEIVELTAAEEPFTSATHDRIFEVDELPGGALLARHTVADEESHEMAMQVWRICLPH